MRGLLGSAFLAAFVKLRGGALRSGIPRKEVMRLILSGSFTTGSNWHYLPLSFNGEAVSGEYFPQEDPWYTANRKSLGNIAEYVQGRQSLEQTLENGAFNLQKAMMVERILDCLKPRQYRMD